MNKTGNVAGNSLFNELRSDGVNGRIFRAMAATTLLAVVVALWFAPWRVTSGLLLGGVLSLVNHHWLSRSSIAALRVVAYGARPRIRLLQYVLRYAVITVLVYSAYKLNLVSLPATIIGLSSFVVALFVEALREFYFAVIHREEIS